jgi:hypothetical protein
MRKHNYSFDEIPSQRELDQVKELSKYEIEKGLSSGNKQKSVDLFLAIRLVFGAMSDLAFKAFYILRDRLQDDEIDKYHYKGQIDSIKRRPYQHQDNVKHKVSYDAGWNNPDKE